MDNKLGAENIYVPVSGQNALERRKNFIQRPQIRAIDNSRRILSAMDMELMEETPDWQKLDNWTNEVCAILTATFAMEG